MIYTNLAWNYPIYLGPQAWIRVLLKTVVFIENWIGYEPKKIKNGCILFKKKRDFDSKDSKWIIFKIEFSNGSFEKNIYFKIK